MLTPEEHKIKSIKIKTISVHQKVQRDYTDEGVVDSFGVIHDLSVEKFRRKVMLAEGLEDQKRTLGLVSSRFGSGYISIEFESDKGPKIITLKLYHGDYEACGYTFRVGDRQANVPLTEGKEKLLKYIEQFLNM